MFRMALVGLLASFLTTAVAMSLGVPTEAQSALLQTNDLGERLLREGAPERRACLGRLGRVDRKIMALHGDHGPQSPYAREFGEALDACSMGDFDKAADKMAEMWFALYRDEHFM